MLGAITRGALTLGALLACGGDDGSTEPPIDTRPRTVPVFTVHLTDLTRVTGVVPTGAVAGDEIKPHSYIRHDGTPMPLYAPVDMELKRGTYVAQSNDYGFEFEINGRFRLRLGHVDLPRADLRALLPTAANHSEFTEFAEPIMFRAGDSIGVFGASSTSNGIDFGVYDLDTELVFPGMERYRALVDHTKLNSVCPYNYFRADLRGAYTQRFETIGGDPAPNAPCRTITDQMTSGGGVSGEWWLESGQPDALYPTRFAIGRFLVGTVVRVGLPNLQINVVNGVDPRTVADEVCYGDANHFVYLRLLTSTTADVVRADGVCPATFPSLPARRYAR